MTIKLTDDDLYPHYSYGEKFSLDQIKTFWRNTVKMIKDKKAPGKLGLYIHIPFCHQKCQFCFCDSYIPSCYKVATDYLSLLKNEIDVFKNIFKTVSFTSVYFGGGSPSFLKIKDLDGLFKKIYSSFRIRSDAQIIFEGTPRDLNSENLSLIARHGVNRLTIGVQSLDPKVITRMKRPQTKRDFIQVFKTARRLGIPYINIDLIAGLEGQSVKSFLSDLKTVLELGADMVHVTGFTPLDHTPFCRAGKKLSLKQKKNREIMIQRSHEILSRFYRDISAENPGRTPGAENVQETDLRKENSSLLGIGYSAQSHAFGQAWYQHPHVIMMKKKPLYKDLPPFAGVRGSLDEEMRKFLFSNLQRGFSRRFFCRLFKKDVLNVFKRELFELVRMGKLRIEGDRIISFIRRRQDFLIYSKYFYSPNRIRSIFKVHEKEYDENVDYQKKLDILYAGTD
ncbi:MAG: radical SAM protein [Spirochaetes bacterium]|nr:radical SAM protein [Spirochaetota bacterium]